MAPALSRRIRSCSTDDLYLWLEDGIYATGRGFLTAKKGRGEEAHDALLEAQRSLTITTGIVNELVRRSTDSLLLAGPGLDLSDPHVRDTLLRSRGLRQNVPVGFPEPLDASLGDLG